MREMLFRGKRADNGQWVYGVPVIGITSGVFMVWIESETKRGRWELSLRDVVRQAEVIPETVGQYTGLDDKNDVKIFEGDVVRYLNSIESGNGVVKYDNCAFLFNWIDIDETDSLLRHFQCSEELEVIGNIHDKPEAKGETK